MLAHIGGLNPPRTLVVSKFASILKPRIMRQLPFIDFVIEKSRITETSDVWRKFLSYDGPKDISQLIVRREWIRGSDGTALSRNRPQLLDQKSVFLVHGRDVVTTENFSIFLRALNIRPIEWSQAESYTGIASPYIGDTIDAGMARAQAVIVLLTGDDEARLLHGFQKPSDPEFERKLIPQARPNVIFEAGYALAKYPARAVIIQIGEVRPFSDIAGRFLIRFDGSATSRKHVVSRLETAGVEVDATGTDWLTAGAFALNP